MQSNPKHNEHPRCGCKSCRRGAGESAGKYIHRQVNRAIRHQTRQQLSKLNITDLDAFVPIVISTGYTD